MGKKWKFMMKVYEGDNPNLTDLFPIGEAIQVGERNVNVLQFEVSKLSSRRFQSLTDDELAAVVDWGSVDNPMRLHSYIEYIDDAKTLSFQVKWGRISSYLLKADVFSADFPLATLSVQKIIDGETKALAKKKTDSLSSVPFMELGLIKPKVTGSGHFVKTGYDWFSFKCEEVAQAFK